MGWESIGSGAGLLGLLSLMIAGFAVGLASGRFAEAPAAGAGAVLGVAVALLGSAATGRTAGSEGAFLGLLALGLIVGLFHAWGCAGRRLAEALGAETA
ncbi:hypothetical protein BH20CHL6_BH20CHL6_01980 [soil metagenome]